MKERGTFFAVVLLACATLVGCGGGSHASTAIPPSISSISPTSAPAGIGPFNLMISGQELSTATSVHFGSDVLSPTAEMACGAGGNCETITVSVPVKDLLTAGPVNVSVSNGGLNSNTVSFTVIAVPSANTPEILAFVPTVAAAGGPGVTIAIIGVNVASGATVNFGATQLTPTSLLTCNPGQICPEIVQVPASAIAAAGEVSLTMTNPGTNGGTSSPVQFLVLGKSTFPIEESVNNASPAAPANGNSTHSSVSAGGAFVAFDSTATNLAQGATSGLSQVYVRNNCFTGMANCVPQTTLVSVGSNGSAGAGGTNGSDKPVISLDGRFVAFESDDTNLAAGVMQPMEQIYLRDTCNTILGSVPSCTPSTTLISAAPGGAPGNAPSLNPTISAFGFFVAFQSTATNLVSATVPAGVSQIYLSGQCPSIPLLRQIPGCTASVALASFDASGNPGDKNSTNASLDAVGLALSFESLADNIVAGMPGNGFEQIYTRITCFSLPFPALTLVCPNLTEAISVDSGGKLGTGDSVQPSTGFVALDVAYATRAPNLLPANTSSQQIVGTTTCVIEDILNLACSPGNTVVISVDQNGVPGQADSSNPAIDGQKIGFTSLASLVPNASGQQVYVANTCLVTGGNCPVSVVLISTDTNGNPIGGDFAAMEGAGAFATFSTKGSSSSPGVSEVFLTGLFF